MMINGDSLQISSYYLALSIKFSHFFMLVFEISLFIKICLRFESQDKFQYVAKKVYHITLYCMTCASPEYFYLFFFFMINFLFINIRTKCYVFIIYFGLFPKCIKLLTFLSAPDQYVLAWSLCKHQTCLTSVHHCHFELVYMLLFTCSLQLTLDS